MLPTCHNRTSRIHWQLICFSSLLLLLLVSQPGCQLFQRFGSRPEPAPVVFNSAPSLDQLIATLNAHSARVQQLQSNVQLSLDGMPKLKGSLQLERPNRLRIKAGVMGVSELGVDVGSNADLFWVWSKASFPNQPPAIYYARQTDLAAIQSRAALPIEPQWIIDATGLVEFSPTDAHSGPYPEPDGRLKIISVKQTATGPLTRVTYLDAKSARIGQQAMYDANLKRIAYSNASEFRYYSDQQVSLPQRIELHVTGPDGADMKLVVDAGEYRINALFGDPDQMWSMPRPDGIQLIDLATMH